MHLTLGILRQSQAVFYALAFFWLDGFAVPTPAQVTQTDGWLSPKSENKTIFESQVSFNNIREPQNMVEFWEEAFKNKQIMWGEQSTKSAIETCKHFNSLGFKKILIPGFGYGRNARPFLDSGFEVTGIEISKTAIELAYQLLGNEIKVFHGSVNDMPFDQDIYDGIFCHALIHLLKSDERKQLFNNCNAQLKSGGIMVFTAITKHASTYGVGKKLGKDLFKTKDGVELFFYDEESIKEEFEQFGLVEATIVEEVPTTKFWKIVCRKDNISSESS